MVPTVKLTVSSGVADPVTTGYRAGFVVGDMSGATNEELHIGSAATSPYGSWVQTYVNGTLPGTYPLNLQPLGGEVGIGTTSPSHLLTVNGTYDSLSRAIAQDVQGFNGCLIRTATLYDDNGRVHQTSRPYFIATAGICSASTPQLTTNSYYALGRVTRADFPNGGYVTFPYAEARDLEDFSR